MTEDLLILGELIAEQAAHMDAAEHRLLTNIREFDHREGWASANSCAHWLSWRVGWTLATAREHVRVAKALGTLPHIDEALRVGKVSYCKVRAMTRVATPLNEQVLLMDAQLTTGAQLERVCRKYRQLRRNVDGANPADDDRDRYLRRRDLDNGMVRIEAVCHPEEAALLWAAIEQATKEIYAARHAEAADVSHASCDPAEDVSAETLADLNAYRSPGQASTVPAATNPAACDPAAQIFAEAANTDPAEPDPAADVSAETRNGTSSGRDAVHASRRRADGFDDDVHSHARHDAKAFDDADGGDADDGAADDGDADDGDADGGDADDGDADDDDADEYEKDCAFFERFGVCPEPPPVPTCSDDDDGDVTAAGAAPMNAPMNGPTKAPRTSTTWSASAASSRVRDNQPARPPFNRLDGLLALARKFAIGESSKTPIEVVVTVSAEALANRAAPEECIAFVNDEGCISAEAARRMSCDAGIVCMVEDANGNPLSVGRRTRSIPTSIGRALRKRDKCCRFPGCTNRLFVDGHHIKHWALGGETALSNLVSLCSRHHKFVHEYGYRVEMDADGWPHFFDPQGRPAKDVPARILGDDLGWPYI